MFALLSLSFGLFAQVATSATSASTLAEAGVISGSEVVAQPIGSEVISQSLIDEMEAAETPAPDGTPAKFPCKMKSVTVGKKTFNVADINDVSKIYKKATVKENCLVVISKQEYRLYVYEAVGKDTILLAHYPVCYAKMTGPKTKTGDMSTPECSKDKPFRIKQIQNAASWKHDFHDGRGSIPSYGNWFIRLDLSKSDCHPGCRTNNSIGIHGCGGNAESVPGNDSEGCIRLRDKDIQSFKENFAQVGTKIVVKGFDKGKYNFELKAEKACKEYQRATVGYKAY